MAIRISLDQLQGNVETTKESSKKTIKNLDDETVSQKVQPEVQDSVSLGKDWLASSSPTIQNMNQYVVSAHKMSSLAEDFSRLLQDEIHQDINEAKDTHPSEEESTLNLKENFNDFSGINLSDQTQNTDSIDNALNSFLSKLDDERKVKQKEKVINYGKEKRAESAEEYKRESMHIREDKIILAKKLERILSPQKDTVIAAAETEHAQEQARPKPRPDLVYEKAESIRKNPKPDAAAEQRKAMEHERYMQSFAIPTSSKPPKKKKTTS